MDVRLNTINQGDCVELMGRVPMGSIDLVFADPPFNIGYDYDVYDDERSEREYLDWSKKWIRGVHRCLSPTGSFWLAIGDEYAAELKIVAKKAGFVCRSWVIWYYTFGVNCARGFSRSHTHLFHFVKDRDDFTFNSNNPLMRIPSARQLIYRDARANLKGRLPDNTWIIRPQDAPGTFIEDHDTWYFARVAGTFHERQGFHGCQMPEQLLGRIIRISSNPNDVVMDPFSGSGTTLAVAKKLGRQWIGLELSRDYVQQVRSRIDGVKVREPLVGPADPLTSAPSQANGKSNLDFRTGQQIPLPKVDDDTLQGIVAAYKKTSKGNSTDFILCDPGLSSAFCKECKRLGLPGSALLWNRLLLRLRKSGRLPKCTAKQRRFSFAEMDAYSFASEIALRHLEVDYELTLDDVLCSPDAVAEFDRIAHEFCPDAPTFDLRWAALAIRKRSKTSKEIARTKRRSWTKLEASAPPSRLLDKWDPHDCESAGAYILDDPQKRTLYVGEAQNVAHRLRLARDSQFWFKLKLSSMRFLPCSPDKCHGLQSFLVGRQTPEPLLNTNLLYPHNGTNGIKTKRRSTTSSAAAKTNRQRQHA